jgi:transmembrane sensor
MNISRLTYLFEQYDAGNATEAERQELFDLLESEQDEEQLIAYFERGIQHTIPVEGLDRESCQAIVDRITGSNSRASSKTPVRMFPAVSRWIAAASVILLLGTSVYFWIESRKSPVSAPVAVGTTDIPPGREGAILTLADGAQIVLDSLGNGMIATQHGARLLLENGQLSYDVTATEPGNLLYNTVSTPKGRQFQLVLPDGSKVWLNAGSSVTYPTAFAGDERNVSVTGEAYFEVVKNKAKPFKVKVNERSQIEVLGTHFNVNAYADEAAINTTLLEGKVKISGTSTGIILQPGQQAQLTPDQTINLVEHADLEKVMAWKNGLFNFNGADIKSVMREIGRWYDLEVLYEEEPGPRKISGKMQRNLSLSQAMMILKDLDINYRLEGRKLIIVK